MPTHETTTLPGGLRVVTEHVAGVRSVALGLWVGAGSRHEPATRAGISHLIEHMLFKGTSTRGALEIAQAFDALGSDLDAATSKEATTFSTRVLDVNLEAAFAVMADMLCDPVWAEFEAEREVVLEEIAMIDDDPSDSVHDLAAAAAFGGHALGRPIIGRRETIERLRVADLAAFHARFYAGGNVVLAAAGNVEHDALAELAARRLAALPAGRPRSAPAFRGPLETRRAFAVKETEQYHVCLGAPGVARTDERRFALALLDAILGGAASSRLFQEVRERRGLAYAIYSYPSHYADTGLLSIALGTRGEHLAECLRLVRGQVDEIAGGRLLAGELDRAKENLKGQLALGLELTSARMSRLGKNVLAGAPILELDELVARFDAVDEQAVCGLARELLAAGSLGCAAIGPERICFEDALRGAWPELELEAA
jgi:predicted Zn-dependent peptidase